MIEIARVVAINPGDHSVDVVLLRTGQRAAGVPLLAQGASTTTGVSDIPPVTAPPGDGRWNVAARTGQDALVALAPTTGGNWVALGLMFPQINAVLSATPGQRVSRHSSGAYQIIGADGTVTMGHPSGATVTMGPTLAPASPVGGDVDGQWRHSGGNASAQVGIAISLPSGAKITVALDGKVSITAIGQLTIDVPTANFTGDIIATGDVKAGSVSLKNHKHGGVQGGGAQTGTPV